MSWPNGNTFGPKYIINHPLTNKPVKVPHRGWRWTQETFEKEADFVDGDYLNKEILHDGSVICGRIWFDKNESTQPSSITYLKDVERFLLRSILSTKSDGGIEVEKLFSNKSYFSYPKPSSLMKIFIDSNILSDDIILDFFAGSGTTGDAVMQLNAEDGGKRKYILAQLDEPIDEKKEAYKFCKDNNFEPVISSITVERLNRAGEKIKVDIQAEFDTENSKSQSNNEKLVELKERLENINKLDIGYKVFSLKDKPCIAEVTNDGRQVSFVPQNLREKTLDTLANMLCATCKPLHTKIETLIIDRLYKADNEIYLLGSVDKSQQVLK